MAMSLDELCAKVEVDLGIEIHRAPPTEVPSNIALPDFIARFYAVADGLELPFITIRPCGSIEWNVVGDWHCFGSDRYFSYCLFSSAGIDLWDHDAGNDPEVSFSDVPSLLACAYAESVEESESPATLVVVAGQISAGAVEEVKRLSDLPTSEVFRLMKSLPLALRVSRKVGIAASRRLRAFGMASHVALGA